VPDPFLIDVYGCFGPDRLRIAWHDEPRPPHADLDALVARTWAGQTRAARESGRILFNGQLARYLRHRLEDGVLVIDVGPTDYANFLATNLLNYPRGEEWGWHLFSNPIGTSAAPITSDGWILLGRRNARVAFHAGYVHAFGGGLEAADRRPDGSVDAFESIRRELHEELGLVDTDLKEGRVSCLGLIRDPTIRQPELVFESPLRRTREEMVDRLNLSDPHQEHAALLACRDEPDAIVPFIRTNTPITPVAIGVLLLHGRQHFGESWYERAFRELSV
jgi:hypothetical protein